MVFALQSMISVTLGTNMKELVCHAIKDTILMVESVLLLQLLDQKISDVKDGTGTIKSALNALQDGLKELMVLVYQSVMHVPLGVQTEYVPLATKDIPWVTVSALLLNYTAQLTLDAKDGIGTTKNA